MLCTTPADTAATRWPVKESIFLGGQQLALLVAVAQPAKGFTAPAPDSSVGSEGEAVRECSRHSDDALASKGLDLLGQQLDLLVAVAQTRQRLHGPSSRHRRQR